MFFEDFFCLACRTPVGFAPWQMDMVPMDGTGMSQQACRNRHEHGICNWLVPPGDPGAMARAIADTLDAPPPRDLFVDRARHYSYDGVLLDYDRVLTQAAAGPGRD